jgi:hypothetical protein
VITCSAPLFEVRIWDPKTLDLWGKIQTNKEIEDPRWFFPHQSNMEKKLEILKTLKSVMKKINIRYQVELDTMADAISEKSDESEVRYSD